MNYSIDLSEAQGILEKQFCFPGDDIPDDVSIVILGWPRKFDLNHSLYCVCLLEDKKLYLHYSVMSIQH